MNDKIPTVESQLEASLREIGNLVQNRGSLTTKKLLDKINFICQNTITHITIQRVAENYGNKRKN